MNQDEMKRAAGAYAVSQYVKSGMKLGLGSGSTAEAFLAILAERAQQGEFQDITCVATSERVAGLARDYGLKVEELDNVERLDVTVDGADEIDPATFHVTKGRGAAALREKIVAAITDLEVIIADESKLVNALGEKMPVPVDVIPFGWTHTARRLSALGCDPVLRLKDGQPVLTDNKNYVLDCRFPPIANAAELAEQIKATVGVVEHGLFIGIVRRVIIAGIDGAYELAVPASVL